MTGASPERTNLMYQHIVPRPQCRLRLAAVVLVALAAVTTAGHAPATSAQEMTIYDYAWAVGADLDGYWSQVMAAYGIPYSSPYLGFVTADQAGSCSDGAGGTNPVLAGGGPLYCTFDGIVWLDVTFMESFWVTYGPFSVAYALAHEWGHHIQNLARYYGYATPPEGDAYELQADCYAGVWTAWAYYEGWLTGADYAAGQNTAWTVGDDVLPVLLGGMPSDGHGDAYERLAAFEYGYNAAVETACDAYAA
jgi:uncharacterized protein